MLKWSPNLSMLFKEVAFVDRFHAAAEAGFSAVEFLWPTGVDLEALVAAQQATGLTVALFNIDAGDLPKGDRGFANDPAKRSWWRERTEVAFGLAPRIGAQRINALAGNIVPGLTHEQMLDCVYENLAWAIPRAEAAGVTLLLEPLNRFDTPRVMLGTIDETLEVIQRLQSPRVQLQFDIYHTQRAHGNLVRLMQTHFARIGHVQIADSPDRKQPGTGEINWKYVLGQLETLGYTGYVGLEYNPDPNTLDSLAWLPRAQRQTGTIADLAL